MKVYNTIIELLKSHHISYRSLEHKETLTSEDSAKERGERIEVGGKAILLKIDENFKLFVMRACDKLHSKAIKKKFKAKKVRFATHDELMELTGLVSGSVPPFGKPILPFELYIDSLVFTNEIIAFNAGSLTHSIILDIKDYEKVTEFETFNFVKEDSNE